MTASNRQESGGQERSSREHHASLSSPRVDGSPRPAHGEWVHVVVIDGVRGDVTATARSLADALGSTPYECRPRVSVPGGGPAVIATYADPEPAQATVARVRAAGFHATVHGDDHWAIPVPVRAFEFRADGVVGVPRDGDAFGLRFDSIALFIRGTAVMHSQTTKTIKERKFSAGRTALTGGLVTRKTETRRETSHTTDAEGFLYVYWTGSERPIEFRETRLAYAGLGDELQPSRAANFMRLTQRLRGAAAGAIWDDRLMRRSTQQQILGPTLDATDHLNLALALVARHHGHAMAT